jgi:hypothetical protein
MTTTNDGQHIVCDAAGCDQKIKNHRWGKTKADNWFFSRDDDIAWCPNHLPAWVAEWRSRRTR